MLLSIQSGEKTISLIVSNMENPPQQTSYTDIYEILMEGQFWFKLDIYDNGFSSFTFKVHGYERRGMMRL